MHSLRAAGRLRNRMADSQASGWVLCPAIGRGQLQIAVSFSLVLWALMSGHVSAAEPVKATLGKETAWTGEAVPLIVTIYSPGPFSGTAAFDLPELPRTAILKIGSPVVGSQDVDGESLFSQRHEFRIYTQQSGTFRLPSFSVRFEGKLSFVGDAQPMQGVTPKLQFQSKRPPGTEAMGVVVATSKMEILQAWSPEDQLSLKAGDVIQRTITRSVSTTAMLLPPASTDAPDGVQVYASDPTVEDKITRGQLDATRIDTIKYQFQRAGKYELPALTFRWWDPKAAELRSTTLDGLSLEVAALPGDVPNQKVDSSQDGSSLLVWAAWGLGLVLVVGLLLVPLKCSVAQWRMRHNTPEAIAARRVQAACKAGDPRAAYQAILDWCQSLAATGASVSPSTRLGQEWEQLAVHLFSQNNSRNHDPSEAWSGAALGAAFTLARKNQLQPKPRSSTARLPSLNP